ncbi:MAG: hypothetical protein NTZ05_13375, partial [Chloroflexi bacterium]|nr:hypothetical protein [Chloroflexota bacterium]
WRSPRSPTAHACAADRRQTAAAHPIQPSSPAIRVHHSAERCRPTPLTFTIGTPSLQAPDNRKRPHQNCPTTAERRRTTARMQALLRALLAV